MTEIEHQNVKSWDEFAPTFHRHAIISTDELHYGLCIPGEGELHLLPDMAGRKVLDVGCGSGENCLAMAAMGACVVGLEPTSTLFELARRTTAPCSAIAVVNGSWGSRSVSDLAPFNLVMFIGSSEYLALDEVFFHQLNRLTSVGSIAILARIHPFWSSLYLHENGPLRIRKYFDHGRADMLKYGNGILELHRLHYGLATIIQLFGAAGWGVERMLEPAPVAASRAPFHMRECYEDAALMERMEQIPMHLILKFCRERSD